MAIVTAMIARLAIMGMRVAGQAAKAAQKAAKSGAKAGAKGGSQSGSRSQQLNQHMSAKQRADAHQDNLKELDRLTTNIQKELKQKIQKQLGAQDITFTGDLRKSIEGGMDGIYKTVESDVPYAYFVEFGLPAGKWVNFDALRLWVEGKLGITDEEESRTVTWKIMKKINSKGIDPKRFMKKGIKALIHKRGAIIVRKKSGKKSVSRIGKMLTRIAKTVKTINKYAKKAGKVMGRLRV